MNETSNWTPGGHIRARGDGRRWRTGRRKSETAEGKGWTEKVRDEKETKKDAESETEMGGIDAWTDEWKRK